MHKRREGFTLIELLIVIVIIGILAAIALPKFGATREKAYIKAMQSDLRNLAAQQEIYFAESGSAYEYFDGDLDWKEDQDNDLNLTISSGVSLVITAVAADGDEPAGWNAVAKHEATAKECAMFTAGESPAEYAITKGVVACNDGQVGTDG